VHEKSEEEWDRLMNTNLKSVFLVSRAVIPGMIARGGGDIINISSLAGKMCSQAAVFTAPRNGACRD